MFSLLPRPNRSQGLLHLLFLGAHPDDIEIGCGGTILELMERYPGSAVTWAVLTGTGDRREEARRGAELFLRGAGTRDLRLEDFPDGFLPWHGPSIKEWFESLKREVAPDVIFTHQRRDLHQDHRLISDLTWNTFRRHLILEYEIPKYDGDLGQPNVFMPLTVERVQEKIRLLHLAFPSQAERPWFEPETFLALARLRGMESGSGSTRAEAFHGRKLVLRDGTGSGHG